MVSKQHFSLCVSFVFVGCRKQTGEGQTPHLEQRLRGPGNTSSQNSHGHFYIRVTRREAREKERRPKKEEDCEKTARRTTRRRARRRERENREPLPLINLSLLLSYCNKKDH